MAHPIANKMKWLLREQRKPPYPTLKEYVLIHQNQKKIECYRREELGVWTEQMYGVGDEVEFRSVDYRGSIESIYHKVPGLV